MGLFCLPKCNKQDDRRTTTTDRCSFSLYIRALCNNIWYWKLDKQLPKTNYITEIFLFSFKTLLVVQQFISCLLSRENYVVNVNITCVNKQRIPPADVLQISGRTDLFSATEALIDVAWCFYGVGLRSVLNSEIWRNVVGGRYLPDFTVSRPKKKHALLKSRTANKEGSLWREGRNVVNRATCSKRLVRLLVFTTSLVV